MARWTDDELHRLEEDETLLLSSVLADGTLPEEQVRLWTVICDGDLYVRSYNGTEGHWYRAALESHQGRVFTTTFTKDVRLELVDDDRANEAIDEAYVDKYAVSAATDLMVTEPVRRYTLRITPEE